MTMRHRPYRDSTDDRQLLELLSDFNATHPEFGFLHPGDLTWWTRQNTTFDPHESLRVFETTDGLPVGFVFNDPPTWAVVQAHPHLEPADLDEMIHYAESVAARSAAAEETRLTVRVFDGDRPTRSALQQRGYTETGTESLVFEHFLPVNQSLIVDRPGVQVRAVRETAEDLEARVALHRAVWQPSRFTLGSYLRLRASPVYRPELDLIAEVEGAMAAYALGWFDSRTGIGLFEPVGTHPDYRGVGLATLVLQEMLSRFQALGGTRALVSTSATNDGAVRLYRAVGFQVYGRYLDFVSPIIQPLR